jgi:hypothetical protein
VTGVDDIDELAVRVRADGPVPLPLDGWDQASTWGWDQTTGSLYAELWRNTDDPAQPPTIRIRPDDVTPAIAFAATLAQHIAMAVDCGPWDVLAARYEADDQDEEDEDWDGEDDDAEAGEGGTVVTMTEGYGIWWPPNFGSERETPT